MKRIHAYFLRFPALVNRPWYQYSLALFAFLDYFIFIIPLELLVIASMTAARKRWFTIALFTTIGSTLGAYLFAQLIQSYGINFINSWAPHLLDSSTSILITEWLHHYGTWVVLGVAMLPIAQHATVAIAALAHFSLPTVMLASFIGRFIKYAAYRWFLETVQFKKEQTQDK